MIFILLLQMIVVGPFACFAAATINLDYCNVYDPSTSKVVISGKVTQPLAGSTITLRVLKDDGNALPSVFSASVAFNYISQAKIESDGKFRFEYKMSGESGYYNVILNAEGASTCTAKLAYVSPERVADALENLNKNPNYATQEGLYNYLSDPNIQLILSIDQSMISSPTFLRDVCGLLIENHFSYTDRNDFLKLFDQMVAIANINPDVAKTSEDIIRVIELNKNTFECNNLKRYPAYSDNNVIKENVARRLIGKSYKNLEQFQDTFEKQVILALLENMIGYAEVPAWFNANNDKLLLDFSTYNVLTDKTTVQKALAGDSYQDVNDVRTIFNTAVNDEYSYEHAPKIGKTTSGSGRSTKITSNGMIPLVTPTPTAIPKYVDLDQVPWAQESIDQLSQIGVLAGDGSDRFNPQKSITREEFVKIVVTAFDLIDETATTDYSDIQKDQWYYKYIASAVKRGIVKGYENGSFGIGQEITRQDMAVLLYRAMQSLGKSLPQRKDLISFTDSDQIKEYAKGSIASMQQAGIINGLEDGRFAPQQYSTRAEAAKMVYELYYISH